MKICSPAKLYLAISMVFILVGFFSNTLPVYAFLSKIFFVCLWTWILSILCKKGMKELAWAFVLLPFIMIGSAFIYNGGSGSGSGVKHREGLFSKHTVQDPNDVISKCRNFQYGGEDSETQTSFQADCYVPGDYNNVYSPCTINLIGQGPPVGTNGLDGIKALACRTENGSIGFVDVNDAGGFASFACASHTNDPRPIVTSYTETIQTPTISPSSPSSPSSSVRREPSPSTFSYLQSCTGCNTDNSNEKISCLSCQRNQSNNNKYKYSELSLTECKNTSESVVVDIKNHDGDLECVKTSAMTYYAQNL